MSMNFKHIQSGINLKPMTVPSSPSNGDFYYNSTSNEFKFYQNGAWVAMGSGGASTSLNNLTTTSINQDLLPDSTTTYDIGSTSLAWNSLYANQLIDPSDTYSLNMVGGLFEVLGSARIDVGNNILYSASAVPSLDWNLRQLYDGSSAVLLDWSNTGLMFPSLTATTVPYLNGSKVLTSSSVTPTELGYVSGVTSAIQTQLNGKQASLGYTAAHAGSNSDITSLSGLTTALSIGQGGTGQTTANSALNALLPSQTGNNTFVLTTNGTNASWAAPTSANLTGPITSVGNTTSIASQTGTGTKFVVDTSPTIITPTITTSATVPLVIGGTATTSTLVLQSTSGIGTTGADIIFKTGNNGATEAMRITNVGTVGIGTNSPDRAFTIKGSGTLGQMSIERTDNASAAIQLRSSNAGGQTLSGVGLGAIGFWGVDTTATPRQGAFVQSVSSENITTTTAGSVLQFATTTTGTLTTAVRMVIDASGKVGIGTQTPNNTLDVVATTGVFFANGNTINTQKIGRIGSLSYANNSYYPIVYGTSSGAAGTNDSSLVLGGGTSFGYATNTVSIYTAANDTTVTGTERLKVDSSGILTLKASGGANQSHIFTKDYSAGTGSSMQLCDTSGNVRTIVDFFASGSQTRFLSSGATSGIGIATLDVTPITLATNASTRITVDSTGNVGVGLAPSARNNTTLQINNGVGFPATQVASSDPNTLDDYEEGTFTPTVIAGTGTLGSYTSSGTYTKVGNKVFVFVKITITAVGTGAGDIRVTNLPFTSSANLFPATGRENALTGSFLYGYVNASSTTLLINLATTGNAATNPVSGGNPIVVNYQLGVSATYLV